MSPKSTLLGAASIGLLLSAWWAACALQIVSPFVLPSPASVVDAAVRVNSGYLGSNLIGHLQASVSVVLVGFLAAAIVGVPLGVAMAWVRPLDLAFGPVLSVLRPIPPPAWIPLSILWFGIGLSGKTFVVFIAAITPCLINSYVGVKQVPGELISAARTLGANQFEQLWRVAVPHGLPFILSGLRIGLSTAWASVVAAELVVATAGFGFLIMSGYRNFEADIMAGGIVAVAMTGFAMDLLLRYVERHLLVWCAHD